MQTMSTDTSFEKGKQEDSILFIKNNQTYLRGMQSQPRSFGVFSFLLRRKQLLTFFSPKFNIKRKCWQHPQWCYVSCLCQVKYSATGSRGSTWIPSHQLSAILLLPPKHRLLNCAWHPDPQLSAQPAQEKSILLKGKGNYMPDGTSFESSHMTKSSHPRKESNQTFFLGLEAEVETAQCRIGNKYFQPSSS